MRGTLGQQPLQMDAGTNLANLTNMAAAALPATARLSMYANQSLVCL